MLQAAPSCAANGDVVDLGSELTLRRPTPGGVPAIGMSKGRTSEKQSII